MVLCREYWGRVTIAVEKMLESFDAILKELVKGPLLLFMEVFKLLLVFNWCIPNFICEFCETWSFPLYLLIVCFNCLFSPFFCPLFNAVYKLVGQILLMDESAISFILRIFQGINFILLEMVVLNLRNLHFYGFICSCDVSLELYYSSLNLCPCLRDLCSHSRIAELFELFNWQLAHFLIVFIVLLKLTIDPNFDKLVFDLMILFDF